MISNLDSQDAQGSKAQHITELQAGCRIRVADASPIVRRAAFRVACKSLKQSDANFIPVAAELLRRASHESTQMRVPVIQALSRLMLPLDVNDSVLLRLRELYSQPGVGAKGVRELLTAHGALFDHDPFVASMKTYVTSAMQHLQQSKTGEDPIPWGVILDEMSGVCPEAFHVYTNQLQVWLEVDEEPSRFNTILAQYSCKIISKILTSLIEVVDQPGQVTLGSVLQHALGNLLSTSDTGLLRAATETLCKVAALITGDFKDVISHLNSGMAKLRAITSKDAPPQAQQDACRAAWIVGTMLEFLDLDLDVVLEATRGSACLPSPSSNGIAAAVGLVLSNLFMNSPMAMRPSLVPCIGFLLHRHPSLLSPNGDILAVFTGSLSSSQSAGVLRVQAMETLSSLLCALQEQFNSRHARCKVIHQSDATVLDENSSIGEAVQHLSTLQPEILKVFLQDDSPFLVAHALSVLQSMYELGVLHSHTALPVLIAGCLIGSHQIAAASRGLVLKLAEANAGMISSRLPSAVKTAIKGQKVRYTPGSIINASARFAVVREVYSETLDSRQLREQFLSILLTAVKTAGGDGDHCTAYDSLEQLQHTELLIGILMRLPFRFEYELAYVLHTAKQFLMLHVAPVILDDEDTTPREISSDSMLQLICAPAILLFLLCEHWVRSHDLAHLYVSIEHMSAVTDQPLPAGFGQKLPGNLSEMISQVATCCDRASKLALMKRCIPGDAKLLCGSGGIAKAIQKRQRNSGGLAVELASKSKRKCTPHSSPAKKRKSVNQDAVTRAAGA